VPFHFSDECLRAFNRLKEALTSALILHPPIWEKPFELMCDASNYVAGVILGQRVDRKSHVIYYASHTLNEAQLDYTMTEKVFLEVVFGFEKFRSYLIGSHVIVHTNHAALKHLSLRKMQNPG